VWISVDKDHEFDRCTECGQVFKLKQAHFDDRNYTDKIRPLYAKLVSFPMSYFVSRQLRKNAKERLKKYNVATFRDFGVIVNNKDKMDKIIKDCYKVLQDKIDSNDYFFGN
ncbi:10445_t:CDS:2, partial [Entrophospora sp. SA101]